MTSVLETLRVKTYETGNVSPDSHSGKVEVETYQCYPPRDVKEGLHPPESWKALGALRGTSPVDTSILSFWVLEPTTHFFSLDHLVFCTLSQFPGRLTPTAWGW